MQTPEKIIRTDGRERRDRVRLRMPHCCGVVGRGHCGMIVLRSAKVVAPVLVNFITLLLLLTTSASLCLQHSRNLEH